MGDCPLSSISESGHFILARWTDEAKMLRGGTPFNFIIEQEKVQEKRHQHQETVQEKRQQRHPQVATPAPAHRSATPHPNKNKSSLTLSSKRAHKRSEIFRKYFPR